MYLGINLSLDNGRRFFFRTNYRVEALASFPEIGEPFCILDGQMLNDFTAGLNAIGVPDVSAVDEVSANMELSLNAVAGARFVAPPRKAIMCSFLPYTGKSFQIKRGTVISMCTSKTKEIYDFIVLDDPNTVKDDVYRVMFCNREFLIDSQHSVQVGAIFKVLREFMCPYRQVVTDQGRNLA